MVTVTDFEEHLPELIEWRRDFHAHPELTFDVERTAGLVAERLKAMSVDQVVTGLGRTGVVGVINGKTTKSGRVIGLRADMDALPIQEQTNVPYASKIEARMHACGHDGHMVMLLGAARYLVENRDFDGTVVLIFQPAEEAGGGGLAMIKDGLMERFGIQRVFAMHNAPHLPIGHFATCENSVMGSADLFEINIIGKGCHAAFPHQGIDPSIAIGHIIQGFQSIVSRSTPSSVQHVVTITQIHMGTADNIVAEKAQMRGTVRSLSRDARLAGKQRMFEICKGAAKIADAEVTLTYTDEVPVTHNDPEQTQVALDAAASVVSAGSVDGNRTPSMGAEDFSHMLEERPGAFMFIGNGETAALHNQGYDFNDAAIPYGCAYFAALVQSELSPII